MWQSGKSSPTVPTGNFFILISCLLCHPCWHVFLLTYTKEFRNFGEERQLLLQKKTNVTIFFQYNFSIKIAQEFWARFDTKVDKRRQRNNTLQNTSDYKKNVLDWKRLEKRGKTSPPCEKCEKIFIGCRCRGCWHWKFFLFNFLFLCHPWWHVFSITCTKKFGHFGEERQPGLPNVAKWTKFLTKFKRKIG